MYNSQNENQLILVDIVDFMVDYCSIQPDMDESKCKSAELVAQNVDIKRLIGKANVERCISPITQQDDVLRQLIIPALCYYTYSRLLTMFPGTFTDGGYHVDPEASDKNVTRTTANEYHTIAETFMSEVIDFLKLESPQDDKVDKSKLTPRIRSFGGKERRASN